MTPSSVFPLAAACLVHAAAAQHLVLPDNVNLGAVNSTASAWRSTAGRFQVAYDSTHFTNAGVTGPVQLTRLRFRARDGETNLGGQVYNSVTVQVGNCAVDYASLGTTFGNNRGTMAALGATSVTLLPAAGDVPNSYVVDIDLAAIGATFSYDPSSGNDLLVDVAFSSPIPSASVPLFAAGSVAVATARARMCSAATAGATTGLLFAPPALLVDFVGAGGYASPQPARIERIGHGCGSTCQSFYQDWQVSETFDLANKSITMLPHSVVAPTGYTVTLGNTPPDLTKLDVTPDSIGDDAIVAHPLGFTFNYASGSTTAIAACTNGFVWLDGAMTATDNSPAVTKLLGWPSSPVYTARLSPFWYNFHAGRNATTHPNSGLHVVTDTSGGPGNAACYVTWFDVGRNDVPSAGMSTSTFQCVLYEATGIVEMRFGSMQVGANLLGITGWSPGRVAGVPSAHPGPCDLSHELLLPLVTLPDGSSTLHALSHGTAGQTRPVLGTAPILQGYNLPAGALALLCLDLAATQPAVPIPGLLSAGCGFSLTPSFLIYETAVLPAASTWSALPLQINASWPMGVALYSQVVALDFALVDVKTTNALKLTIGLN